MQLSKQSVSTKNGEVLYTFTSNNSYAYLLNVKPSILVLLNTHKTEFKLSQLHLRIKMLDF